MTDNDKIDILIDFYKQNNLLKDNLYQKEESFINLSLSERQSLIVRVHFINLPKPQMKLDEAIEQVLKDFPTIKEDVKTNPKAVFSLVGPIRNLIPNIDPKLIKSKLEEALGAVVPEKDKKVVVGFKHDVWQNKTTKELIRRVPFNTEERLTDKIRGNEFIENCFGTCYVCLGSEFVQNYVKVDLPMIYKKLILKSTGETILKPKEKVGDRYIYMVKENNKYCFHTVLESEVELT